MPPKPAERWIYQLGNNSLHKDIYRRALVTPGVAVLHDAVLAHFHLGQMSEDEFVAEFVYNYGAWRTDLARVLWQRRASSAASPEYFRYPMLKRIAERSKVVVVTNPAASRMVREHAPGAVVREIPLFFAAPDVLPEERERWRAKLVQDRFTYVIGLLGHLRESKRVMPVLRAFHRLRQERPNIVLAIAGEFVSEDLEQAAEPLLAPPGIRRFPHLSTRDFNAICEALDCCVNLRFPTAGESSGIHVHMMGIGKPLLLSTGAETERFPEGTCIRINPDLGEEDAILESLRWLVDDGAVGRRIGAHAARYIAENHSLERVVDLYLEALRA